MKRIKLTESQYNRLFENKIETDEDYGDKSVVTATVQSKNGYTTNKDGEVKRNTKNTTSNDFGNDITVQHAWRRSYMPCHL